MDALAPDGAESLYGLLAAAAAGLLCSGITGAIESIIDVLVQIHPMVDPVVDIQRCGQLVHSENSAAARHSRTNAGSRKISTSVMSFGVMNGPPRHCSRSVWFQTDCEWRDFNLGR